MTSRHIYTRRRVAVVLVAMTVLALVVVVASRRGHGSPSRAAVAPVTSSTPSASRSTRGVVTIDYAYSEAARGSLPAPVKDPAAGPLGVRVGLAGGLDASSTSTARVVSVDVAGVASGAVAGHLPVALHDAAGASLQGVLYVFGGGDAVGQLDSIYRVAASGAVSAIGKLPAASSDSSAAAIGRTAYVVGGYDGSRWLDTIVAFTPGSPAHIVGHLPTPVRYAAVASAGGRVFVAGGSLPNGSASSAVYEFDPTTGATSRVGTLPLALTHATAGVVRSEILVVGGRGSTGTTLDGIVAIDPVTKRVRLAGRLNAARSDAAVVASRGALWLLGGHNSSGTLAGISVIRAKKVGVVDARARGARGVYAHDRPNDLSAIAARARQLVYVPNSQSNTVDVIDQSSMRVIDQFAVGALPQHVTPSWDLRTLYVDNDMGDSLTPIDPNTGKPRGPAIAVTDPYNLYFTPDGQHALVVAERFNRLDVRNPETMALERSIPVPCRGVDHMDFTADGRLALASCEFSGDLVVVDVQHLRVVRTIALPRPNARPQDVKLSPSGGIFYVADMNNGGAWEINARTLAIIGFLPTGAGAHGLYPSRDATHLYVTNRGAGTISVVDFAMRRVIATWLVPGGSPDMGGVSADGRVLWLSGRYNAEVYAISTSDGHLIARIPVGAGPHGLCVWPQPGRYSLGHTGIMR